MLLFLIVWKIIETLEQCIGRCGRQGQPGSSTLYVSHDDFYYETKDFKI